MSEPKDFLSRWSERKLHPETEKPAPEPKEALEPKEGVPAQDAKPAGAPPAPLPAFDISTLPSLESITANSDIRAFLQRGVPEELARAALRRAWSTDPAIRDFVGLSENAWDFNNPDSIHGFGTLSVEEAKQAMAQLFRVVAQKTEGQMESQTDAGVVPKEAVQRDEKPPEAEKIGETEHEADASVEEIAESADYVAMQQGESINSPRPVRRHGGALPK